MLSLIFGIWAWRKGWRNWVLLVWAGELVIGGLFGAAGIEPHMAKPAALVGEFGAMIAFITMICNPRL